MTDELNDLKQQLQDQPDLSKLTDAEVSELFLEDYKKLCVKYNRDFIIDAQPKIAVVNFRIETKPKSV